MIKKIIYGLLWIIILFLTLFTFDLTNFDTKYHNRGILSIDVKNLNSIYSKKFSNYLRIIYLKTYEFVDKESYNKRWGVENFEDRINLPNEILISENTYNIIRKDINCKYVNEIKVKGKSHPIKTFQVQDLILSQGEKSTIDYETDGFSLMLDKEQIKNKKEIIGYLKKSIDHLKH